MWAFCGNCSTRHNDEITEGHRRVRFNLEPEVEEIVETDFVPIKMKAEIAEDGDDELIDSLKLRAKEEAVFAEELEALLLAEGKDYESFNVSIERIGFGSAARLGIDCTRADDATLDVIRTEGGLVGEWNREHPEARIEEGHRIFAVNKVCGNASLLLKRMMHDERVELVIGRPRVGKTIVKL
mmetsp:Transcript_34233/g.94567  ORF Transcript_34233/g.94567 Transcript_34233/m.94567 type:complete len:183 (-) Transcript_34233:70-618(-)